MKIFILKIKYAASYLQYREGRGDGRAMSIGEILVNDDNDNQRCEMQLKGAGSTPFCGEKYCRLLRWNSKITRSDE